MWKVGTVTIKNRVVLAPMASVSNSAYRTIIKKMGAGLIVAEMVSDKAVMYKNKKTLDLLYMTDFERPISQQIFGSDTKSFVEAAKFIEKEMKPDIIDINMGCPVPKIAIKSQAGSALLKDPDKIKSIVRSVVSEVKTPVTVKIRSGWDSNNINAVEVAKICEEAGASAITIHGRTRKQGYSGHADWNIIKEVKNAVSIPVIGNGDVTTPELAKQMIEFTNCDAVMIGRGALGNPWLIKNCVDYLSKGSYEDDITLKERINMMKYHLDLLIENKPEKVAVLEMRTQGCYYLKGVRNASGLKSKIAKAESKEEFNLLVDEFIKEYEENE